jgi:hypothetical protein
MPMTGNLREDLLHIADARTEARRAQEGLPVIGRPPPETTVIIEETSGDERGLADLTDPEVLEAAARVELLKFTKKDLEQIRSLTATAITTVLTNGSYKERLVAAKLGLLLSKLELENYRELRKQSLGTQGQTRRFAFQFAQGHLTGLREEAIDHLKVVNET